MLEEKHHKGIKSIGEAIDLNRFQQSRPAEKTEDKTAYDGLNPDIMYYIVYVGVACHFKLKTTETNVLSVIWSLQQKRGWCYASQTTIALAVRISVQALNPILKKLEKRGLLEKGVKNKYGVIRWRLGAEALDRMRYVEEIIQKAKRRNKRN